MNTEKTVEAINTMARAAATIDLLTEEVADLRAQNRVISETTRDLLRMISALENERDTWRAKAEVK